MLVNKEHHQVTTSVGASKSGVHIFAGNMPTLHLALQWSSKKDILDLSG